MVMKMHDLHYVYNSVKILGKNHSIAVLLLINVLLLPCNMGACSSCEIVFE